MTYSISLMSDEELVSLINEKDIFSELDSKRKEYVTKGIKKCQVIITSCEKDGLESFAGNVIQVEKGNYSRI